MPHSPSRFGQGKDDDEEDWTDIKVHTNDESLRERVSERDFCSRRFSTASFELSADRAFRWFRIIDQGAEAIYLHATIELYGILQEYPEDPDCPSISQDGGVTDNCQPVVGYTSSDES